MEIRSALTINYTSVDHECCIYGGLVMIKVPARLYNHIAVQCNIYIPYMHDNYTVIIILYPARP